MKIVNMSHSLQSSIIVLFDFYISLPSSLSFRAPSNSLPASTFWYLVLHSLLARGWVAGQSAKDQQINQLGLHLTPWVLLNLTSCPQRYNTFQRLLSQKSFQNPTKQTTSLLKTEIRRLWSPSEKFVLQNRLYTRAKQKAGLGQAKRSFSIWRHSFNSPQISLARSRTI